MKKLLLLISFIVISGCALTSRSPAPTVANSTATSPITFGTSTLTLVAETASTTPFEAANDTGFFVTAGGTSLPYSFVIKTVTQKWKTPTTTVEVSYPVMTYAGQEGPATAFNVAVLDLVNAEADNFLREIATSANEPADVYSDYGNDIQVSAWPRFGSDNIVSVQFVMSTYYAGATHPTTRTFSLNFDLNKSKELQLSDLFIPKSNYLVVLSKLALAALDEIKKDEDYRLDPDWVKEGAGPTEDNFHTVNLSWDGLLITFDTYDVDAYAAGPYEIVIPYEDLYGVIAPDILFLLE